MEVRCLAVTREGMAARCGWLLPVTDPDSEPELDEDIDEEGVASEGKVDTCTVVH